MPLDFTIEMADEGITIPYPGFVLEKRINHGFQDLRGNVAAARRIAEVSASQALAALLARCAEPGSPIFTAGCDLGRHVEATQPRETREVAGGYFHLVPSRFDLISDDDWLRLANILEDGLDERVGDDTWIVRIEVEGMQINLDNFNSLGVAIRIVFYALAGSPGDALAARERLLSAIDSSLDAQTVLECWRQSLLLERDVD